MLALTWIACTARVALEGAAPADAEARWAARLAEVVTPAGRVRYDALAQDHQALDDYLRALAAPWPALGDEALLARRLNTYNAAVLRAVLEHAPIRSVRDVKVGLFRGFGAGFFVGTRLRIDGRWVDLYSLEHRLIRAPFRDPRVHAVLSCASEGCPPLSATLLPEQGLGEALDAAVRLWLRTRTRVGADEVVFNEVFQWFEDDFLGWTSSPNLCAWAARYDPRFEAPAASGCPHRFEPYDWSLNAARPPEPLAPEPFPPGAVPWTLPAAHCPPGMVYIAGGRYTTGMKPPEPYGVVQTLGLAAVEAPEQGCAEALARTPGATACWVQTDLRDPVVPVHEVEVEGYCIESLPFPGAGPYSPDGMTTVDAARFEQILGSGRFGPRRMCTFTEYELAVAGPKSNLRFVYGDEAQPRRCEAPEGEPIGSRPRCVNPETGVGEYGAVISQWVLADPQFVANACPDPPCFAAGSRPLRTPSGESVVRYVVAGGTQRQQTRQAPYTPHTWHDHGDPGDGAGCDAWGYDDGPAVCADPDPRTLRCPEDPAGPGCAELAAAEARWAALRAACVGQTMNTCLDRGLSELAQDAVVGCPEGPPVEWTLPPSAETP